ncbi:hypothetical protein HDV63DRAFT_187297 [Trichoderma sp. SZMC 28014]
MEIKRKQGVGFLRPKNRLCEPFFCNLNKTELMLGRWLSHLLPFGYHENDKNFTKEGKRRQRRKATTQLTFLAPSTHTHTHTHTHVDTYIRTQNAVLQQVCFDFFAKKRKKKRDKRKKQCKKKLVALALAYILPHNPLNQEIASLYSHLSFLFLSHLAFIPLLGLGREEYFSLLFFQDPFAHSPPSRPLP